MSADAFWSSIRSAEAANTSTTVAQTYTFSYTEYSSILYTLEDGYPRLRTKYPTTTSIDVIVLTKTLNAANQPGIFTGVYPDCISTVSGCGNCTIYGASVQLNYWPTTTVSQSSNRTITSTNTGPVVAIVDGTTFTSPSVYLSFDSVYAKNHCRPVGSTHPGAVISLNPDAVHSLNGYHDYRPRSFNYADLEGPLPFSVFSERCEPRPLQNCLPIPDGDYFPILAVPDQIRDLDPAWKSCELDFGGSFDPPRVLQPASVLVEPTATSNNPATLPPALPAASAGPQEAKSTDGAAVPPVSSKPIDGENSPKDPPAKNPPAKDPPTKDPPTKDPPSKDPPTKDLPTKDPPTDDPPTDDPPSKGPPTKDPLIKDPPTKGPSTKEPPSRDSPTKGPSPIDSPTKDRPVKDNGSPPKGPLTNDPPSKDPQVNDPPAQNLPVVHSEAVITLGSQPITVGAAQSLIIGSSTLHVGGAAARISGKEVSIATDGVLVGGRLHTFSATTPSVDINGPSTVILTPPSAALPTLMIGSKSYVANAAGHYIINEKTLTPAGSITVSGAVVSLDLSASFLIIGGTTEALTAATLLPILTFESLKYSANSAGKYIIDGRTLTPGGVITKSGTVISLAPSASALVVGGTTQTLSPITALPTLTIGSCTYTANPAGQYIINGQTLSAGGVIIDSGTTISLAPSAAALMIGSVTETLKPLNAPPVLTIRSRTYTANPAGQYIIDGQTLTAGGAIIDSGTVISLAPLGSALIIGSVTDTLKPSNAFPTLTIGSHTYTANPAGEYIIDDQTLAAGGVITDSGTIISLAPSASVVVVGGVTETLVPTPGFGRLILQGFSTFPGASASSAAIIPAYTGAVFEGGAKRSCSRREWLAIIICFLGSNLALLL